MDYVIEQYISKLSKRYNYFESRVALKLLAKMNSEEKELVLANEDVKETIMHIDDTDTLRAVFRNVPASFQEEMFSSQNIQDLLIAPDKTVRRKYFFANYNQTNRSFKDSDIRMLETFIHTIKSPRVRDLLIENKVFQRVIALCKENQLKKSFFRNLDEVKLFNNIINDEEIYYTKKVRRKNILSIFNNVSPYILLTPDYLELVESPRRFIEVKRIIAREYPQILFDANTLAMFTKDMLEELLEIPNIDRELAESYLKDDIIANIKNSNYDFKSIFSYLLTGRYDCFNGVDLLTIKIIMNECPEEVKEYLVEFMFSILCNTDLLDSSDKKIIKDMLRYKVQTNSVTLEEYKCLFNAPSYIKTLFYLRFGVVSRNMNYLNDISKMQLMKLNVKHINRILKVLKLENEDEISNIYAIAIKMYLVFGLERTIDILQGSYGSLTRTFFDNISLLNTENVELVSEGSKYIPVINDEFIKFMFASKQNNHFKDMLNNPDSLLAKNFSYLYNNILELKRRCHDVLTLNKLDIIFKQLSPTRDIKDVTPDNYELNNNNILNDVCLGNKTRKPNEEIYKSLLDIYALMKKRTESSIPYVKGSSSNGYSFEMMKFNDPIIFTLGYKGNCCIRINDIAHNHLLHAALCRNGRMLLIYNEKHELAAFVPLKRNGEVLIANSIECAHKKRDDEAIVAFLEAVKSIVDVSKSDEEIKLVCIGSEAYARPDGEEFPKDIPTPQIYEKDNTTYKNTDVYHKELTIVYKNPNLNLKQIKYGDPKVSYQDPRGQIRLCDFYNSDDEKVKKCLQVINAVRYTNADIEELEYFRVCSRYGIKSCIYNDDWYIITTSDDNVYGDVVLNDPRAELEYNKVLDQYFKQYSKEEKILKFR